MEHSLIAVLVLLWVGILEEIPGLLSIPYYYE